MGRALPRHWRHRLTCRALVLLGAGCNCAEAVLRAFLEEYGYDPALYRLATGLGAGIGTRRDVCGLLSGCVLVLGLLNDRGAPHQVEGKRAAYPRAARIYDWFAAHGGVHCRDIVTDQPFRGHTVACRRALVGALAEMEQLVPPPPGGEKSLVY